MLKNAILFCVCAALSIGLLACFPHVPAWKDVLRQRGLLTKTDVLLMSLCFILGWLGPWAGLALSAGGLRLAWESRKPWIFVAVGMAAISLAGAGFHGYYLMTGVSP